MKWRRVMDGMRRISAMLNRFGASTSPWTTRLCCAGSMVGMPL